MPARMSRAAYADMFGPTTGDKVRLADTEFFIEVEKDFITYGEEVKFCGGSMEPLIVATYKTQKTRQRTEQLLLLMEEG